MVTHAEAKIHRVGPRHTIYLAKDLVEDSTFPFRADEDLRVRIEGDALIIDKDGRSGRRPPKLDEAHSHRDKILTKTLDVLNFSPLTSKAERINKMLSEIHEAEMLESRVRHMPKNEHAIFLWEEETFLDMVLSEFFDPGATGKASKGLLLVLTKWISEGAHGIGAEHRAQGEGEHDNPLRIQCFEANRSQASGDVDRFPWLRDSRPALQSV